MTHQYGTSALVSGTSFSGETSSRLFSQATRSQAFKGTSYRTGLTRILRQYRLTRILDYLYKAFLRRREPDLDSATAAHTHLLRFFRFSCRLSPLLLGFGSDFEKSFKSLSRIFKQASWRVSDFTINHPSMTAHDRPYSGGDQSLRPQLFSNNFTVFFYVPFQLMTIV